MLGRKTYTQEELDHARAEVGEQLAGYRRLAEAIDGGEARSALEAYEPVLFNNLTLTLDRLFVHRLRVVTGKDGNPLNEVELLAESLMNNGGVLRGNNVVRYEPGDAVLGLEVGDEIRVSADGFERLANAFLDHIEAKFVQPAG